MKKFLKIIGITTVSLLLIIVSIPFIVTIFVDPNDYKPEISKLVEANIGRTLTINGDINLSVFPWLGISLGELQLSNSTLAGFSKTAFAKIKSADVHIKLAPLFSRKVEIDKISLAGLTLSLEKNKLGVGNWQDLSAKESTTASTTTTPDTTQTQAEPSTAFALPAIAGIEIIEANINWNDQQLNQQYQLKNFNFTTGKIANNTPTDISLGFTVVAKQLNISGTTKLTAKLQFNIDALKVHISQLKFTENLTQNIFPPKNIDLKISADIIKANLKKQTASISNLKLSTLDLDLNISLTVHNFLRNLNARGVLSSSTINPKKLLDILEIKLPKMADSSVLNSAKLDFKFSANLNKQKPNLDKVKLSDIKIKFDDSNLVGNVALIDFSNPKLRYNLKLDTINVDRYLPPPVKQAKATTSKTPAPAKTAQPEEDLPIPVDLLRSLDIKGSFALDDITVAKLKAKNIKLNITAKDANIRLNPISASLYQGQYQGDVILNVKQDQPIIKMQHDLSGVEFKPLVTVFMGEDYVSGKGNAKSNLTTKGKKISDFTKNLNGTVAFNINDAKLKYLNPIEVLKNKVNQEVAKIFKKPFKKKPEKYDNPDVFKIMKGTLKIVNGLASNDDFIMESGTGKLTGKGTVDLVKEYVKYTISMHILDPKTNDAELNEYLTRNTLNNSIYGPFDKLSYNNFNYRKLIGNFFSDKLKRKVATEKKKLEQAAKKKVQAAKKKLDIKRKELEQAAKKKAEIAKQKAKEEIKKKLGNLFK